MLITILLNKEEAYGYILDPNIDKDLQIKEILIDLERILRKEPNYAIKEKL